MNLRPWAGSTTGQREKHDHLQMLQDQSVQAAGTVLPVATLGMPPQNSVRLSVFALFAAWTPTTSGGLTVTEAARADKRPRKTVQACVEGMLVDGYLVATSGARGGEPVYRVHPAAAHLAGAAGRRARVLPESHDRL